MKPLALFGYFLGVWIAIPFEYSYWPLLWLIPFGVVLVSDYYAKEV